MDASKVIVSPEHLRFEVKGRNKRAALRRNNVIELIRSKPPGTPITLSEFQKVCGYTSTTAAHELLKTMLDRGTILRQQVGFNRYCWFVAADAVVTSKTPQTDARMPNIKQTLADLAKEFAWESNSDSLREFIKYVEGKS